MHKKDKFVQEVGSIRYFKISQNCGVLKEATDNFTKRYTFAEHIQTLTYHIVVRISVVVEGKAEGWLM